MSEEKKTEKKAGKPIERVTINDEMKEKLARLTEQANTAMQGIAHVSRSDVVQMILEDHTDELSPAEIERLKANHIDQVKLALWLANAARDAKRAGKSVTLKELLERCESVLPAKKVRAAPRTKRGPREGVDSTAATSGKQDTE